MRSKVADQMLQDIQHKSCISRIKLRFKVELLTIQCMGLYAYILGIYNRLFYDSYSLINCTCDAHNRKVYHIKVLPSNLSKLFGRAERVEIVTPHKFAGNGFIPEINFGYTILSGKRIDDMSRLRTWLDGFL